MDQTLPDTTTALTAVTTVTEHTLFSLPPALIDDVCFGLATLPDIFVKHGYTAETAEVFRADSQFKRLVTVRADELEKEGVTPKMRDGALADATRTALLRRVSDPNTATPVLLDVYKAASKLAGREPKGPEVNAAGTGFSITFNLPGAPGSAPPPQVQPAFRPVIDVTPEPVRPTKLVPPANPAEFELP